MTRAPDDSGARYRAAVTRFADALTAAGPKPARADGDPAGPVHWLQGVAVLGGDRSDAPLLAAAETALALYPGPVGELLHREIHAYLEIGHRFGGDALIHRLAAHLSHPEKESTDG